MFDIFVGCMLHVASMAIAGVLFSPVVTDILSILRHEKASALILGSFCIVIFIGTVRMHFYCTITISWAATVLKTQLILSACNVNFLEVTYLKTLYESFLWTKVISNLA